MEQFNWTFPGGKIKTVEVPATAGNVDYAIDVPSGKRWLVICGNFVYVADATVINRSLGFRFENGAGNDLFYLSLFTTSITAGLTRNISLATYGIISSSSHGNARDQGWAYIWLPPMMILEESDRILMDVTNGQAGDSYSGFLRVLEIDEPA